MLIGLVVLAGVIYGIRKAISGPRLTEEQKIRKLLAEAEETAEQGNYLRILNYVSDTYRDEYGYNRDRLRGLLVMAQRDRTRVAVSTDLTDLKIEGATARAQCEVRLDTGRYGRREYSLTLTFAKEGRDWKVTSATGWGGATELLE